MNDSFIAVSAMIIYVFVDQWVFRCQRVGRGVLLVAKDSFVAQQELFSSLMPSQYVTAVWLSRLLWILAAWFAWRAWGWYGLASILLYVFVFNMFVGSFLDRVSPWPSYERIIALFRKRISSGAAGYEAIPLVLTIARIEKQMAEGVHFEAATVGVWMARSRAGPTQALVKEGSL